MPLAAARTLRTAKYALKFDGVDDYAQVPSSTVFDLDTVTIEGLVWFNRSPVEAGQHASIFSHGPISLYYFLIGHGTTNYFQFGVKVGGTIYTTNSTTTIKAKTWYHVVATYDASTARIYVNVVEEATRTVGGVLDKLTQVSEIGKLGTLGYLNGLISYVRVYSRALTQDEILWNYLHPDNPVRDGLILWLYARPEYISGSTWEDLSGFGNDGTIYGAVLEEIIKSPSRSLTPTRTLTPTR